jgi:hypothetical protein
MIDEFSLWIDNMIDAYQVDVKLYSNSEQWQHMVEPTKGKIELLKVVLRKYEHIKKNLKES